MPDGLSCQIECEVVIEEPLIVVGVGFIEPQKSVIVLTELKHVVAHPLSCSGEEVKTQSPVAIIEVPVCFNPSIPVHEFVIILLNTMVICQSKTVW